MEKFACDRNIFCKSECLGDNHIMHSFAVLQWTRLMWNFNFLNIFFPEIIWLHDNSEILEKGNSFFHICRIALKIYNFCMILVKFAFSLSNTITPLYQQMTFILSWTKQGGRLPAKAIDNNGVLVIPNVQPQDQGNYVCTGSDMMSTDTAIAVLTVSREYIFLL